MTQHQTSRQSRVRRPWARKTRTGALIALASAALLAIAAVGATPASAAPAAPGQAATGWVRLGHFAPAEMPVDLAVDGEVVAEGVAFREVTDYLPVSAGTHQFRVLATGAGSAEDPLLEVEAGVPADGAVTVAAVATRSGLGGQVYDDDLASPPDGSALVRFIHASPDVAAVDVAVIDGPVLATGVAYPVASPYEPVPAGTYDLRVTAVDGGDDLIQVADWTAAAGSQSTIVVVRGLDGEPDVVPINDSDGTSAMPVGGLATGFGGLAEPPSAGPSAGGSARWVVAGAAAILTVLGLWLVRTRQPRGRPAALLALAGMLSLGAVSCGQASQATTAEAPQRATSPSPTSSTTVPDAPTVPSAPPVRSGANVNAAPSVGDPVSVSIPAIGVRSDLVRLGLEPDGSAEVPDDPQLAGWFTGGPRPGDAGPAVIAGHVDTKTGPAVFARLDELTPGDEVEVTTARGTVRFVADRAEQVAKDEFPTDRVYGPAPGDQLRLITCGGSFDRSVGHYRDNIVVYLTEVQT